MKGILGWILGAMSLLMGLLVALFVLDILPPGPLDAFVGGVLSFGGFLFGEAAPAMGRAVIERFTDGSANGGVPPTTTIP